MRLVSKVYLPFICVLGIFFALILINTNNVLFHIPFDENKDYMTPKTSIPSAKIHINNNWSDAEIAGICTGSGLIDDPYIIQDYEINGGGSGSCILIENSSDYFTIENCTISNCGDDFYDAGIKLISVLNGNVTGNQVSTPDGFGIVLYDTNNTIVTYNRFAGEDGISVKSSHNDLIYLNDFINQLISIEIRNTTQIEWDSPDQIEYVYYLNTYTNYLGNYWNDYNEQDIDDDGIGDIPHIIDQHLPSSQWVYIDDYPLVSEVNDFKFDVEVQPPDKFILSSDAGDADIDGNFTLNWNTADRAVNYSIFQYSTFINTINVSLMELANGSSSTNLPLFNYSDGTYYFIVVAYNDYGQTLSNCINIVVEIPPESTGPTIPGFSFYLLFVIVGLILILRIKQLKSSLK
jgi:parallel beta-helix repeat protein